MQHVAMFMERPYGISHVVMMGDTDGAITTSVNCCRRKQGMRFQHRQNLPTDTCRRIPQSQILIPTDKQTEDSSAPRLSGVRGGVIGGSSLGFSHSRRAANRRITMSSNHDTLFLLSIALTSLSLAPWFRRTELLLSLV